MEQVTLWVEGNPRLYVGMAMITAKKPILILRMTYSDLGEVICQDGRYHWFRVSPELSDRATEFWPYRLRLLSLVAGPMIDPQWLHLRFECEPEEEMDMETRCGSVIATRRATTIRRRKYDGAEFIPGGED